MADIRATVDAIWRMEAAKIIATLTRAVGDVGLAEDLAADALVDALTQWPQTGVPHNGAAWLTTVAKRKAIDGWRRQRSLDDRFRAMARELETQIDGPAWDPDDIDDDVLRLIFISTHPVLSDENRIALTLRVVGGLTTDEIAHAFLVPKATVAQRIVRAKKTLADAGVPFEVPARSEYPQRISAVLSVIYLIFNEGYTASSGDRWVRDELGNEALRLGRVLAALIPEEPEVHGLIALMEFQASRFGARTDRDGRPIPLDEQDRTAWNRAQISRGVAALTAADATAGDRGRGPYALQAALAECHATAASAETTDWARIVSIYEALGQIAPSPIVDLNRAVAIAMATGPQDALRVVDELVESEKLAGSHLLPSVRGELLSRLHRCSEAAVEFDSAAAMTGNERERDMLREKAAAARAQSS